MDTQTLLSVIWQVLLAVLGALLGLWIPMLVFWWKYHREPRLLGEWVSAYQGIDEPHGTWVTEKVDVSIHFGKMKLKNKDSSCGYDYTAYASVADRTYLSGQWESIRPGANAYGGFLLTVSSQGNIIYGYWAGPDKLGARRYGRWVLARNDDLLEEGKVLIEEMRKPIATAGLPRGGLAAAHG